MVTQESKRSSSSNSKQAATLGAGLEKLLSAYASAAAAAGVSLLAMANSAEARIVYTPGYTNIPVNNSEPVLLDLNHDGIGDFSFWNLAYYGDQGETDLELAVGCAAVPVPVSSHRSTCRYPDNQIWGRGIVSGRFASALQAGFRVRRNRTYFQQGQKRSGYYPPYAPVASMAGFGAADFSGFPSNRTSGQFLYTKDRYLGLQFIIDGQAHYGWVRLTVARQQILGGIQAAVTGYAYETIPDKPIITGKTKGPDVITLEPASLGHLAQGASGISAWREKK